MKLLVVEDEPTLREALLRLIAQWGYAAQAAANGREALDWLELELFDLVLLDLGLPDRDGLEVCRALRQVSRRSSTGGTLATGVSARGRQLQVQTEDREPGIPREAREQALGASGAAAIQDEDVRWWIAHRGPMFGGALAAPQPRLMINAAHSPHECTASFRPRCSGLRGASLTAT